MATPGVLSNCLFYFVSLDGADWPVPSTMRAKENSNQYDVGNGPCTEARLPPYQMTAVGSQRQCFAANKLRYFYKVSKLNGTILPNSMWSQLGKPQTMCSGTYQILEYKRFY